jgi:hypothetical protein
MGTESTLACVDSSFRVFGLEKLRIVDLSVSVCAEVSELASACARLILLVITPNRLPTSWERWQRRSSSRSTVWMGNYKVENAGKDTSLLLAIDYEEENLNTEVQEVQLDILDIFYG